jgi:hypothetical protein
MHISSLFNLESNIFVPRQSSGWSSSISGGLSSIGSSLRSAAKINATPSICSSAIAKIKRIFFCIIDSIKSCLGIGNNSLHSANVTSVGSNLNESAQQNLPPQHPQTSVNPSTRTRQTSTSNTAGSSLDARIRQGYNALEQQFNSGIFNLGDITHTAALVAIKYNNQHVIASRRFSGINMTSMEVDVLKLQAMVALSQLLSNNQACEDGELEIRTLVVKKLNSTDQYAYSEKHDSIRFPNGPLLDWGIYQIHDTTISTLHTRLNILCDSTHQEIISFTQLFESL